MSYASGALVTHQNLGCHLYMCVLWGPSLALLRTPFLVFGAIKHTKLIELASFCLGVVVLHFQLTLRSVERKLNWYFVIRKLADDRSVDAAVS